ncbi:hypothetical protein LUZ60_011677 [Juncus effusus]|nr:hypothetical protein LUZ60_011677 [Juncus effusus]
MNHQEVKVRLFTTTHIPLSQPLPLDSTKLTLSLFDVPWIGSRPIQRLLLFQPTDHLPSFSSLIQSLKSSLSITLQRFFILAGKLVHEEQTGDVVINCSSSVVLGVAFVEAEADGDIIKLIEEKEHDVDAFCQLVPDLNTSKLPAPLFFVQVTELKSGGMAIGFSIHHAVADGRSVWNFIHAWTAACKGGELADSGRQPNFDRRVIKGPWSDEVTRGLIRRVTPNLPVHGIRPQDETYLCILADCRSRLDPPIDDRYFGNCVQDFAAKCTAINLLHIDGLLHTTIAVQKAIKDSLEEALKGSEDWLDRLFKLPPERITNIATSPRFKVYDTDFGWGKPSRLELVSMSRDGAVVLVGAKDGNGVQVSVCLDWSCFDAFESCFFSF